MLKFTLWEIISKNRIVEHIFLLWSISSLGSPLTLRKNSENFPMSFGRERLVSCIKAKISNVQKNNIIRKRTFKFKFWVIISKNRIVEHIFLLWSISSLGSPLTLRKYLGNFPVSFGRERALYQLISIKKAQIHTLRDHIKKSNRRTYFSFVINLIIRVSSNPEEKFRKFPRVVWTGEGALSAYR